MYDKTKIVGQSLDDYLHIVKAGPARYLHRRGILAEVGPLTRMFGRKAIVNGGKHALAAIEREVCGSLGAAGIAYDVHVFSGESSLSNVAELIEAAEGFGAEFVIGAGGGKALDTAKIAADCLDLPMVTVPTIAATCAATTPLGILYCDDGVYLRDYYPLSNPRMVLVDPEVQLNAPAEYLKSGILDSLSKWYEGGASFEKAQDADIFDSMAIRLAEYLNENMIRKAGNAIRSVARREMTGDFVDVVNMNIYLAGTIQAFGVKAVRNGIAHSVHNGLTALAESHSLLHGIKVGYGIAILLVLLEGGGERLSRLSEFYRDIGFEPSFKGLGLRFTEENIATVARKAVSDPLMKRPPFDRVSYEMVVDAIGKLETEIDAARR